MTEEFAKIVNRLARAKNFDDGSYLLITQKGEESIIVEMKGSHSAILSGIGGTLKQILNISDDKEGQTIREWLREIIIEDEQQRFQKGEK